MDSLRLLLVAGILATLAVSGQTVRTTGCLDGFHGPWINENQPTKLNRNDTEIAPNKTVLNQICDPLKGTLMVHCKDPSGEAFTGTRAADSANHFTKSCTVPNGLICRITKANATCPDMSMQYGCNCSTPQAGGLSTGTPKPPASGGTASGGSSGTGRHPGNGNTGSGNTGGGNTGSGTGGSGNTGSGSGGNGSGGNGSCVMNMSYVVFIMGLILSNIVFTHL